MKKKQEAEKEAKKKTLPITKSFILFEVKVWDHDQDYDALAIEKDGLFWKTKYVLEDVAFGVKKIVIGLVVEEAKVSVDDIVDELDSWEDNNQSIDIAAYK